MEESIQQDEESVQTSVQKDAVVTMATPDHTNTAVTSAPCLPHPDDLCRQPTWPPRGSTWSETLTATSHATCAGATSSSPPRSQNACIPVSFY